VSEVPQSILEPTAAKAGEEEVTAAMRWLAGTISCIAILPIVAHAGTPTCEDASTETFKAIHVAAACLHRIEEHDSKPTAQVIDDCIQVHQHAISLANESERACSDQPTLAPKIRETRKNLEGTVETLKLDRRYVTGQISLETLTSEMLRLKNKRESETNAAP
jgi:hypothetical protein